MELGIVIAERHLMIQTPREESQVRIQIGAPQPSPDKSDWLCPYRIQRVTHERLRFAADIDAVQALELVTQIIEADLFLLNRQYKGGLCWPNGTAYFQIPNVQVRRISKRPPRRRKTK